MLKKQHVTWFAIVLSLGLLILIRAFEDVLFYDPFLFFFKQEDQIFYPKINIVNLLFSFTVRYFLNSFLTLVILFSLFNDYSIVKFSSFILMLFLLILLVLFFIFWLYFSVDFKMILFYIRRFLIQPLFLVLFVPGFYFQQLVKK